MLNNALNDEGTPLYENIYQMDRAMSTAILRMNADIRCQEGWFMLLHAIQAKHRRLEMAGWGEFAEAMPEMAERGKILMLLYPIDGGFEGGLAYLATIRRDGGPRIHPISPVLLEGSLYAFVLKGSPKLRDLLRDPRYALHSYPRAAGPNDYYDEEFYITGQATPIPGDALRARVAQACGDDADAGEVFELSIERAMHKGRDKSGAIYTKWRDDMRTDQAKVP
jgi:hypothetical protein